MVAVNRNEVFYLFSFISLESLHVYVHLKMARAETCSEVSEIKENT
jgi:hypothetical protein